ncbi:MAG TPA: phosphatidylglycerophosphatase A [Acidimicrobiia bacterium]|nr:phosphatidylglycerophosphatase A [Acidimicrobiia bacterium]
MHRLVASFFGSGLLLGRFRGSNAGSGTVGALFALPISLWAGLSLGWWAQLVGAVILTIAALWSTRPLAPDVGDASWIVIDEAAGAFVATIGLLGWPALIAFVVFRIADIFKSRLNGVVQAESLPGALGITADDLVAGLYGLAVGHLMLITVF